MLDANAIIPGTRLTARGVHVGDAVELAGESIRRSRLFLDSVRCVSYHYTASGDLFCFSTHHRRRREHSF